MGLELAAVHGVDADKVDFALATHDLARAFDDKRLLEEANRRGLRVSDVEHRTPVLLHGPIAAAVLEFEENVSDRNVLEAVRWHTTGTVGMGDVAKVVFLADKLDPAKKRNYPFQDELHQLASNSLDEAVLFFLNKQVQFFVENNYLIHPNCIKLRNHLLMQAGP